MNRLELNYDHKAETEPPANRLSLLGELGVSAGNQAKNVYNAVAEVSNAVGANLPRAQITEQTAAPTASPRWWMQEAGSLAVTLPLVLLTHKAVSAVAAPAEGALARGLAADSGKTFAAAALSTERLSVARMAATGGVYEGLFRPSNLGATGLTGDGDSLAWSRLKHSAEGALSFGAMQAAANKVPSGLRLLPGFVGGGTYGIVHSQSEELFNRGQFAGMNKTLDAAARGAILGTALSGVGMLKSVEASPARPLDVQVGKIGTAFGGKDVLSSAKIEVVEPTHPDYVAGRSLSYEGRHAEAVTRLTKVLEAVNAHRGEGHAESAPVLSTLARSEMFQGNNAGALNNAELALAINKRVYGENSQPTAEAYEQISTIHQRAGNYDLAAQSLDMSIKAGRTARAAETMRDGEAREFDSLLPERMQNLADLYKRSGNSARAAEVMADIPKAEPPPIKYK